MSKDSGNKTKAGFESEDQYQDGDEGELIEFEYRGQTIIAKDIDMDKSWTRINPETRDEINVLCSYGFSSCLATICKSLDNKYISLRHDSFGKKLTQFLSEAVYDEIEFMNSNGNESAVTVSFGFAFKTYHKDVESDPESPESERKELMDEMKSFLDSIETKFNTKIINLNNTTILIDRAGNIDTSVLKQTMQSAKEVELESEESEEEITEDQYDFENDFKDDDMRAEFIPIDPEILSGLNSKDVEMDLDNQDFDWLNDAKDPGTSISEPSNKKRKLEDPDKSNQK